MRADRALADAACVSARAALSAPAAASLSARAFSTAARAACVESLAGFVA
ncbi:hypothetical protein [Tateyamaria sp.]